MYYEVFLFLLVGTQTIPKFVNCSTYSCAGGSLPGLRHISLTHAQISTQPGIWWDPSETFRSLSLLHSASSPILPSPSSLLLTLLQYSAPQILATLTSPSLISISATHWELFGLHFLVTRTGNSLQVVSSCNCRADFVSTLSAIIVLYYWYENSCFIYFCSFF